MAKLTLSIDSNVVEKAKKYLQTENQSLSKLVENYFRLLVQTKQQNRVKSSLVGELTGVAKNLNKKPEKVITNYLQDKYR